MYIDSYKHQIVSTILHVICFVVRRATRSGCELLSGSTSRMPFPEPETALPETIDPRMDLSLIPAKIARPAARQGPSTTNQSLTRRLNDLQARALTTKDTKVHEGLRGSGFLREPSCPSWWMIFLTWKGSSSPRRSRSAFWRWPVRLWL